MMAPGPEEYWTGILNQDWSINWEVLETSIGSSWIAETIPWWW